MNIHKIMDIDRDLRLSWWLNLSNHIDYPSLYRMAVDILSIPPMLSKLDRMFLEA
jgi:hAT family C-terminal dimerisation region